MQSSANTAWVGLIVIVSALLLSSAMLVLGGSGIELFTGHKYFVLARFDDVTGIDPGMQITANGQRVGKVEKILEQKGGRIGAGPIDVKLRIDQRVVLGPDAKAEVTQPELLGDQVISLEGLAAPDEPAAFHEGDTIPGVNGGGLAQMITEKAGELTEELHSKLELVMAQGMITIHSVNEMLGTMNEMLNANKGAIQGTMLNVQAASKNMVAMSASLAEASNAVAKLASDPKNRDALQGITANLYAATSNLKTMSDSMNTLISDPKMADDMKGTVAAMRQTTENLNASLTALKPTLGKVDTLLDTTNTTMKAVGDVATGVSGIVGGVSDAVGGSDDKNSDGKNAVTRVKGKTQSGISKVTSNIHAGLTMDNRVEDSNDDLGYDGDDLKARDINAILGYGDLYAQIGADEIGTEKSGLNLLIGKGNPDKGLSFKTGVIRGEAGSGVSYRTQKNGGIDAYMYDSNDPKYNGYIRVPVGRSYSVLAGMEDITGESQVSLGIGATY